MWSVGRSSVESVAEVAQEKKIVCSVCRAQVQGSDDGSFLFVFGGKQRDVASFSFPLFEREPEECGPQLHSRPPPNGLLPAFKSNSSWTRTIGLAHSRVLRTEIQSNKESSKNVKRHQRFHCSFWNKIKLRYRSKISKTKTTSTCIRVMYILYCSLRSECTWKDELSYPAARVVQS